MLFIKLLRYLTGYVGFEAKSGFFGRFINLCKINKIPLWQLKTKDGVITAETTINGYKKLRHSAKKSAVKPQVTYKKGVPFLVHGNRMRIAGVIAVLFGMLLFVFASQRIWIIEINGNKTISNNSLMYFCETNGLARSSLKKNVSIDELQRKLKENFPLLSWASVNIKGCTAYIDLYEMTEEPEIIETETPVNIVAACDGYLTKVNLHRGEISVNNNTAVSKGDLLISGIITRKDESVYTVHAKGECIAETRHKFNSDTDRNEYKKILGIKEKNILYFFGIQLFNFNNDIKNNSVSEKNLTAKEKRLPIGIIKDTSYKIIENEGFSPEERMLLNVDNIYLQYKHYSEKTVINDTKIYENAGDISCELSCKEDIAEELPIDIDFNNGIPTFRYS